MADTQQPQAAATQPPQVQTQDSQMVPPVQQPQPHIQQLTQQQPKAPTCSTPSITGIIAPQAPIPQPAIAAASNIRSPGTAIPQLQVIGQTMHGQPYLAQFQGFAQPFMIQNANALAAMQMNQMNLAALQQQQRATSQANPGSPGTVLSPANTSQITTQMPLATGNNLIPCSVQNMLPQTQVGANAAKGQVNGAKGQQATNGATITVAKQQVIPAQTASPQVVLGNIGVFPSQANGQLPSGFITQVNSQMVNNAGQMMTSQPVQNILTNQALMQAMANLQMQQQGIPTAPQQQIIAQGQSQMPAFLAGQNIFIRTSGPIPQQPITVTGMQPAAFATIKPQQQQTVVGTKTPVTAKVLLPSKPTLTAKIQPSVAVSQHAVAKMAAPTLPKPPKAFKVKGQVKVTPAIRPTLTASSPSPVTPVTITSTSSLSTAVSPATTSAPLQPLTSTAMMEVAPSTVCATPIPSGNSNPKPIVSVSAVTSVQAAITSNPVNVKPLDNSDIVPAQPSQSPVTPKIETAEKNISSTPSIPVTHLSTTPTSSSSLTVPPSSAHPTTITTSSTSTSPSSQSAPIASTTTTTTPTPSLSESKDLNSNPTPPPPIHPFSVPECKLTVVDDMVIEEKPSLHSLQSKVSAGLSVSAAMEAAGLTTFIKETKPTTNVETTPALPSPLVVEKQKAIVKPQVITHVIEGYVIQEGLEPFPVQQTCLLQEFTWPNKVNGSGKESEDDGTSHDEEPPTLLPQMDTCVTSPTSHRSDDVSDHIATVIPSPQKEAECESCHKTATVSAQIGSHCFCSLSCSRRFVSHTRRTDLFKSKGQSKKRKQMKGWRSGKDDLSPSYSMVEGEEDQDNAMMPITDEMSCCNSSSSATSPHSHDSPRSMADSHMETEPTYPNTDPSKWSVIDVYNFVNSLPGCAEHADDFRSQEIDGQALLLLKEDHLMTAMNIKLGPALKICAKINSLRVDPSPT